MSELALKLYTFVDGVNDIPFPSSSAQAILTGWQYNAKRMGGAPSITGGTIIHNDCLDDEWTDDVYVEYRGEKFFAPHKPTSSYSSQSIMYEHKVDFLSERAVLDNVYFYDVVSEEDSGGKPISNNTKFTFFGTISEFIVRLNASMQRSNTGYSVVLDENQENSELEKQVKFDTKYISEALQEGFKVYGIPYYFVGKVCHYGDKDTSSSILDNVIFEYGRNKSLISTTKTNANTKIVNRITGVGSQDNIPYYYPNSSEEGIADVDEITSSSTLNISVIDDMLLAKKVAKNSVLEFGSWEIRLNIPMFYGDGEAYSSETPASSADFSQKTIHIVVPISIPYNCSELALRLMPWPILKPSESIVTYANFALSPDITGKTITPSSHDNYIDLIAQGNISKGTYYLSFDATFPYLYNGETVDFSGNDILIISANTWKDLDSENFYQDLTDIGLVLSGTPTIGDTFKRIVSRQVVPQSNLMPPIYRESEGNERFYNATNNTYINPDTGEYYVFPKPYKSGKPKEYIHDEKDIKPTIVGVTNANLQPIDQVIKFAFDENDSDDLDEKGNYVHPYFFALLHKTDGQYGFNLFDQTIEEEEMTLAMTSGSLGGCEFVIGVSEESQKNTVQIELDANLEPLLDEDGHPILKRDENGDVLYGLDGRQSKQVPQSWQNDTRANEVWVALKKDVSTYGIIMPNATYNYKPQEEDEDSFVLLHIDLPKAYILAAEQALENALIAFMAESNEEHWNFSIDFSRIYFKDNTNIANALDENKKIRIKYNGVVFDRYILSYSYKTLINESLPSISVELAESIQTSSNPLDTAISQVTNLVEQQANTIVGYQQIARLARTAIQPSDLQNAGNEVKPIYFNGRKAQPITGLDVPNDIHADKDIHAGGGVSAEGITDLSVSGGGGGGTGTIRGIEVNGQTYDNPSVDGILTLPDYPDEPTHLSDLQDDSSHRTVTDTQITGWNAKYNKPSGGIPKSDLSSAVQASLDKADGAVQKTDLASKGSNVRPVYFDDNAEAQEIDGLHVPENVEAGGGVSARGITDLGVSGGGGGTGGGVETVSVNGGTPVQPDPFGNVDLDIELADLPQDSTHRTVTDTEKSQWNAAASKTVVTYDNLNPSETESTGEVPTAFAVAVLKKQIGVEDNYTAATSSEAMIDGFEDYDSSKSYTRGDTFRRVDATGHLVAYRVLEDMPTLNFGKLQRINFKALITPLTVGETYINGLT